jgi:anti-sigma-K factor RskA
VTDPRPGHGRFDELAAGYALHTLDPGDRELFARHARGCARCQRSLADYADVAAAIAGLAPAAEPSPQLAARIMAAATGDPASGHHQAAPLSGAAAAPDEPPDRAAGRPPARVRPLHRHRSRLVKAAAAAAAAVIVGGGIWGGLAATGGPAQPTLTDCVRARQCAEVVLTAAATHRTAAKVIIRDGVVWMEPAAMNANPGGEIYVLWQLTGAHTPLAVGSFDIRPGAHAPVRIGGLAAPYRKTWAFAVSLEHGRTIPATPSHPVALGQVSA